MTVKTQIKRKMTIICSTIIYDDKKELISFHIYLIYAERSREDFYSSGMCTGMYCQIISAAADEGPSEMTCFPAGLHYLLTFPTRMSKNNTEIGVSLCELFREKMS